MRNLSAPPPMNSELFFGSVNIIQAGIKVPCMGTSFTVFLLAGLDTVAYTITPTTKLWLPELDSNQRPSD